MRKIAFFDTKAYDKEWFNKLNKDYEFIFIEGKLNPTTAQLAKGCEVICGFVNDDIGKETIDVLYGLGVRAIVLRCAGYNNVDFKEAYGKINIMRVPAYSPHAVAEHAMALLLTLNRKIHKAYNRTRDFNFSLSGLIGMDLHGKTVGIIGTGKIGKIFINICKGFGMKVIAYDLFPDEKEDIDYVDLDTLFRKSDIISLHCPLTKETRHILSFEAFGKMKDGVYIINTSRGGLIESGALLHALTNKKVAGAGLDVYEEEGEFFFEDFSNIIIDDDVLSLLVSKPNVIITSHQGFFTREALENIAKVTLENIDEYFSGGKLTNEICYQCEEKLNNKNCRKEKKERCF
ncbi:2-hydroxyacid dehydrogenase [Fusobacterium sp. MFO224]|uniref:2-hydroxyacid dehydrogenase n=1 Tax=Fusobacterium sp. MFO224 TaxID=3378070 RepID=UPI003854FDE7